MYSGYNRYKILKLFFDSPNKKYQLRELERESGISLPSVRNHVRALKEEGFVREVENGIYNSYKLADNQRARIYKRNDLLARLEETGLIRKIENECRPNCIVLFGSAVEGKDDKRGDVDLFVQSEEKGIDLTDYERDLERDLSLLFEPDIQKLNEEIINTLINGITLRGFLEVK